MLDIGIVAGAAIMQALDFTAAASADSMLENGKVAMPKMAIPGVGYQAYCLDTEGNVFGIHQPDAAAK